MDTLVFLIALILLALLALRFGHDSRYRARSQEDLLAEAGYLVDHTTTSVLPEEPMPVPGSIRTGERRRFIVKVPPADQVSPSSNQV